MPKRDDKPFLQDIAADPGNDALRLIYADWLDDNGRPLWAEFIRLRHELAGVLADALRRASLVRQERELIARIEQVGDPLPRVLLKAPRVREVPGGPALRIVNSIGMTLALIPAGKFLMGSPTPRNNARFPPSREDEDVDWSEIDYNGPPHEVTLTRPFYLGVYPVTWKEYELLVDDEAREEAGYEEETPRHPVHNLCWGEAQEFCEALSAQDDEKAAGRVYRLPTEAEWEYACRADTLTAYWTGDVLTRKQATFDSDGATRVGKYPCNPFGLHDMHGNVMECCQDLYGPYSRRPQVDPRGAKLGDSVVFRGGSFAEAGQDCTSYQRFGDACSHFNLDLGLRVALDVVSVVGAKPKPRRRKRG